MTIHPKATGLLGKTQKGPDYMKRINDKAKRMEQATKPKAPENQLNLPYCRAMER